MPAWLFVNTAVNRAHKVTARSLKEAWEVYITRLHNEDPKCPLRGKAYTEARKDLEHDVIVFDDSQIPEVW